VIKIIIWIDGSVREGKVRWIFKMFFTWAKYYQECIDSAHLLTRVPYTN